MMYVLEHSTLGWCWWDLPAFLVLLAVIVVFIVRIRKQKSEEKDLEDQLSRIYAEKAQEAEALMAAGEAAALEAEREAATE